MSSSFAQSVNEDHFASISTLPNDGEAWADLFEINTLNKNATTTCPTGCLPIYFADPTYRHGVAPKTKPVQRPSPAPPPPTQQTTTTTTALPPPPAAKKSRLQRQVYMTSAPEIGKEVTTRSGRVSKRPPKILILDTVDHIKQEEAL